MVIEKEGLIKLKCDICHEQKICVSINDAGDRIFICEECLEDALHMIKEE